MELKSKRLGAVFYSNKSGGEPVREWLKLLSKADKKIIGEDIKTVQYGWPLGMPLVDSLGKGLWEVRVNLPGNRIARILFFMHDSVMVLVNGFIKKSRKTPKQELDVAMRRKKQYEQRGEGE